MSFTDALPFLSNQPLLAAGATLALLAIVVFAVRMLRRWRDVRVELSDPPPLLIPVQRRGGGAPPPLYPARFVHDPIDASLGRGEPATLGTSDVASAVEHRVGGGHAVDAPAGVYGRNGHAYDGASGTGGEAPSELGVSMPVRGNGGASSKVVHTIPPMDGTLQFLPGRLEVIDGESPGRDIRFVRTWGEVPEISFGRVSGPPFRHVQLRSQTVSRQHARMQYADGRWKLTNLSQTNPVVINGQALDAAHGTRVLHDGDQIEMGEVVFRFRER